MHCFLGKILFFMTGFCFAQLILAFGGAVALAQESSADESAFVEVVVTYSRLFPAIDSKNLNSRKERKEFARILRSLDWLEIQGRVKPAYRSLTKLVDRRKNRTEASLLTRKLGRHLSRRGSIPAGRYNALTFLLDDVARLKSSFSRSVRFRVKNSSSLGKQLARLQAGYFGDFQIIAVRKIALTATRGVRQSKRVNQELAKSLQQKLKATGLANKDSVTVHFISSKGGRSQQRQLKKSCTGCSVRVRRLPVRKRLPVRRIEEEILGSLLKGADVVLIDAVVPGLERSLVSQFAAQSGALLVAHREVDSEQAIVHQTRVRQKGGLAFDVKQDKVLLVEAESQLTAAALATDLLGNTDASLPLVMSLLSQADLTVPNVTSMVDGTTIDQVLTVVSSADHTSNARIRILDKQGNAISSVKVEIVQIDNYSVQVEQTKYSDHQGEVSLPAFRYNQDRRVRYKVRISKDGYQFFCNFPVCEGDKSFVMNEEFFIAVDAPGPGWDRELVVLAHRPGILTRTLRGYIYGDTVFNGDGTLREDLGVRAGLTTARGLWRIVPAPDGTYRTPPVDASEYYRFGLTGTTARDDRDGFRAACQSSDWFAKDNVVISRWARAVRPNNGYLMGGHVGTVHATLNSTGDAWAEYTWTPAPQGILVKMYGYPNAEETRVGGGATGPLGCYSFHYQGDSFIDNPITRIKDEHCPAEERYTNRCERDVVGIPLNSFSRHRWKFEFAENDFTLRGLVPYGARWPDKRSVPGPDNPLIVSWIQDLVDDDGTDDSDGDSDGTGEDGTGEDGSGGGSDDGDPRPDENDDDSDPDANQDPDATPSPTVTPSPSPTPEVTPSPEPSPQPTSTGGGGGKENLELLCSYENIEPHQLPGFYTGICCGVGFTSVCNSNLFEDSGNCSQDCSSGTGSGDPDPTPTPVFCPSNQSGSGAPAPAGCCGNGVCEPKAGEDLAHCPSDCGASADPEVKVCVMPPAGSGAPLPADCCGNKVCEYYDTQSEAYTCPEDCLA